ncbi:hypothetical protein [Clostridium sp.]|uniref:hypothetical protein n=1 Tax=Clostridium sp. TaxID=1506 RepID=UPI003F412756
MSLAPYYEYLLVLPTGDTLGFNDLDTAKGYVYIYYEKQIKDYSESTDYMDVTELVGQVRNNICQHIGVDEGECVLYSIPSLVEKLQENLVFDEDKQEIISKLLSKNINLNIYEYSIDNILTEVEKIQLIDSYGEI